MFTLEETENDMHLAHTETCTLVNVSDFVWNVEKNVLSMLDSMNKALK